MKLRRPFNGNFTLTQSFGARPEAYAQFGIKGHNGLDYGLPHGTPVVAALEGKVTEVGNDTTGYGGYAKIENDKQGQLFGHLSRIDVKVGDTIYEGQQSAYLVVQRVRGELVTLPAPTCTGAGSHNLVTEVMVTLAMKTKHPF